MSASDPSLGAHTNNTQSSPILDHDHVAQDESPARETLTGVDDAIVAQPEMWPNKSRSDNSASNLTKSSIHLSRTSLTSSSGPAQQYHDHVEVRTLPPWVDSFEAGEYSGKSVNGLFGLIPPPSRAHHAQHHFSPATPDRRPSQDGFVDSDKDSLDAVARAPEKGLFGFTKEPDRGRKWDHAREGDPVVVQSIGLQASSPWADFVKSSMYGPALDEDNKRVDEAFLNHQTPGYDRPWRGYAEGDDPEKALGLLRSRRKRRLWYQKIQHILLTHPLVPLGFRITVLTTSLLALGLAASVYHLTHNSKFDQNPSTIMAIAVDVVAIPYICYMTWDEYTGKPLGLRSPKAKILLVLLDLFFIIFESANLSLAFAALSDDDGSCREGINGSDNYICSRIKTLGAFLLIALVAWGLTFTVSLFRLVERVGGRDESG